MREYYVQRASAGLLISEGTQVSPEGKGYMDTPGIYSDEQVAGWREITDAVHEAGGLIAAQLWHVGRVSHESFHDGEPPVSASALPYRNRTTVRGEDGRPTRVGCPTPRALELDEIPRLLEDYRRATVNAREAGFDLVEIHGAHGYLLHQFLAADSQPAHRRSTAARSANRARLMLEVTDAVDRRLVLGPGRRPDLPDRLVQRHRGPRGPRGRAVRRGRARPSRPGLPAPLRARLGRRPGARRRLPARPARGPPRSRSSAPATTTSRRPTRLLEAGLIDAAAFGRSFIANPDLPRRLVEGLPLNPQRPESFYGGDAEGYTDYPAYA